MNESSWTGLQKYHILACLTTPSNQIFKIVENKNSLLIVQNPISLNILFCLVLLVQTNERPSIYLSFFLILHISFFYLMLKWFFSMHLNHQIKELVGSIVSLVLKPPVFFNTLCALATLIAFSNINFVDTHAPGYLYL